MPATAVIGTAPGRGLAVAAGRWSAIAVGIVLATAAAVWLLAPADWQRLIHDEQRTDATVSQWLSIWLTNFVICSLPLLAGAIAQQQQAAGRTRRAGTVMVFADLIVLRSLVTIGLVGGLDPAWLAGATPWWLLEVACLGLAVAAGSLARHCADRERAGGLLKRAAIGIAALLSVAAFVEVALT